MNEISNIKKILDLKYYFLKCKIEYHNCLGKIENEFFKEELTVPIESLILKEESISILFDSESYDDYIVDVTISLFSEKLNKQIGYYRLIENLNREYLDEFLVFF